MLVQPLANALPMEEMPTGQTRHPIPELVVPKADAARTVVLVLQILRRDLDRGQILNGVGGGGRTGVVPRHDPYAHPAGRPLVGVAQEIVEDALDGDQVELQLLQDGSVGGVGVFGVDPGGGAAGSVSGRHVEDGESGVSSRLGVGAVGSGSGGGYDLVGHVTTREIFVEFESKLRLVGREVQGVTPAAAAPAIENYGLGFHHSVHGVTVGSAAAPVHSHN